MREEADSEEVSRERSAKVKTDPNPNRSLTLTSERGIIRMACTSQGAVYSCIAIRTDAQM